MNYVQKFLSEVADKYEVSFPDVFEEAFYILAERMSPEDLLELTREIVELEK